MKGLEWDGGTANKNLLHLTVVAAAPAEERLFNLRRYSTESKVGHCSELPPLAQTAAHRLGWNVKANRWPGAENSEGGEGGLEGTK